MSRSCKSVIIKNGHLTHQGAPPSQKNHASNISTRISRTDHTSLTTCNQI